MEPRLTQIVGDTERSIRCGVQRGNQFIELMGHALGQFRFDVLACYSACNIGFFVLLCAPAEIE